MPTSQAEWEAHWAFYELTVKQRDGAWVETRDLRRILEMVQDYKRAGDFQRDLAEAVLIMAAVGHMPDTYWPTDSRVALACKALGWTPEQARDWAREYET
jgi:hypothetical protein